MSSTMVRVVDINDSGNHTSGSLRDNAWLQSIFDAVENTFSYANTFTPTWTAASVNPVLNNGTMTGYYFQIGKWVQFKITITMGSSTTFGTGTYTFGNLPASAANIGLQLTSAYLLDSGTSHYRGTGLVIATTATCQVVGSENANPIGPTVPFTFAVNDQIVINGGYVAT